MVRDDGLVVDRQFPVRECDDEISLQLPGVADVVGVGLVVDTN